MDETSDNHAIAAAGAAKARRAIEAELWATPHNQRLWPIRQELIAEIDSHQRRMRELVVSRQRPE